MGGSARTGLFVGVMLLGFAVTAQRAVSIPPWLTEEDLERQAMSDDVAVAGGSTAAVFDSQDVALLSQVLPQQFSTNTTCNPSSTNVCANDVWGFVSKLGREYAVLGLRVGTGFVDVTDPYNPFVVGAISDSNSIWSDMKVLWPYAYNVNESGGGMQIINLSEIDPPTRRVTLAGVFNQSGLQTSHTLYLNTQSRFAYLSGSNLGGGRLVAINLANPASPQIAGQMIQATYVHAAQIVTYNEGPYAGREIAFCYCGGQGLKIVDVTTKSNMFTMATLTYPTLAYCHQGELTADRQHVVIDDELDESQGLVPTTTTYVVNVSNLSAPFLVTSFTNGQISIDHNQYVRGNFTHQANYTTGYRVQDIANVNAAHEVGYFDTYPFNNGRSFNGAWGCYGGLPSGSILISDMQAGLFVLDPSEAVGPTCTPPEAPQARVPFVAKNRYLSVIPGSAGEYTALRLRILDMPPPFESLEGSTFWLDRPASFIDGTNPPTSLMRSRLRCTPAFMDWGSVGAMEIADPAIVPGGSYEIQAIRTLCARSVEANFSTATPVSTSALWGDIIGSGGGLEPDGIVDAFDIVGQIDKFKQVPGAPTVPQADLYPSAPDQVIDALDVTLTVDAFKGLPYPLSGATACP